MGAPLLVGRIPREHSVATLLGTLRWLREDPGGRAVLPRTWPEPEPMRLEDFRAWLRGCLDRKITAADPRAVSDRVRKLDPDHLARLRRDVRAIRDYRTRGVVRRGSGLETAEGRRAAPDVHAAMREPLEDF